MGNCNNSSQAKVEKSTESVDPPVAVVAEPEPTVEPSVETHVEPTHPAPITVDLHNPPVDASAPLDERDIELVQQTFGRVAMLGVENVGWVIFMNIFEIAPAAKGLFPFKDDEDLANSTRMKAHAGRVVSTMGTAVSLLRDLPTLVPVLHGLGLKHVGYGVIPAHYDVVGQAIIKSLGTALGDKMTPAVTNAYLKVYTIVKNTMLEKCDYSKLVAESSKGAPAEGGEAKPGEDEDAKANANDGTKKSVKKQADSQVKKKAVDNKKRPQPEAKKKEATPTKEAADAPPAEVRPSAAEVPAEAPAAEAPKEGGALDRAAIKEREANFKKLSDDEKKKQGLRITLAAKAGNKMEVQKCLTEGVSANAIDGDGWTALMKAAERGDIDMMQTLMNYGAETSPTVKLGEWGNNALHHAARNSHTDAVKLLIEKGKKSDVTAKNFQGKTPKDYATDSGIKKMLSKAAK